MQKKKSAVPAYLGVAAVWIGSHFGPGFATGAFSVRWYVKYGWIGLITPLLAMLVTGGVTMASWQPSITSHWSRGIMS